jgi:kynurenine 3-monooxygenase
MKDIGVIGTGLVGSLLSVYLARRGYNVNVYDRRPDIRKMKVVQGKSINLALSDRGWRGLREAGIEDEVRKVALPMKGRMMHAVNGELTYQPYGRDDQAIYSVSRGLLNQELLHCASKYDNVHFHFQHRCLDLKVEEGEVIFRNEESGENISAKHDHIFGTDGAFSAVRARLSKIDRYNFSQEYLSHGYKELEIPPLPDGGHRLDPNCLHIWPRGEFMMIALPNPDGSFTCTLFIAFEGKHSFENLKTPEQVRQFFDEKFSDAVQWMPDLEKDFFANPNASLVMTKCYPWHFEDKVCILGDAAHAIVPFYGQGMNAGFEDCRILNELIEKNDDFSQVFPEFTRLRKPAGDAILELALRNYIEMRDKTADPQFLHQKKIEAWFSSKYPEKWIPLYSQVSFSHIPYHEALANGNRQQEIMNQVMSLPNIYSDWQNESIEHFILKLL